MAWDLQTHMHAAIAPSVWAAARDACDTVPDDPRTLDYEGQAWLHDRYADQRWDDTDEGAADFERAHDALIQEAAYLARLHGYSYICDQIAEHAIEHVNATTNGGHEVYLDGYTSVEWCSDDTTLAWWS